jgi:hypothetical protein
MGEIIFPPANLVLAAWYYPEEFLNFTPDPKKFGVIGEFRPIETEERQHAGAGVIYYVDQH